MSIADRFGSVTERVERAAREAGRDPATITLVAVTKTFGGEAIEAAIAAGQRVFGENRVQEAQGKWPELLSRRSDLELHLIGPLQTNKARDAVALFHAIHSVDRDRLAMALAAETDRQGQAPKLFVQVNTGEEPSNAGVSPRDAAEFVDRCRDVHGLAISGLMCIPPFDEPPGPHFALLRKIAEECGLAELSMGMSGDFETAIAFGATHLRLGSALFGER